MIYVHDTRDKPDKHKNVDDYLLSHGHQIVRSKMYVGDMTLLNNQSVCIDLKQDLQELCGNVCQQHKRFRAELERAQEYDIKLIILCEHGGSIKTIDDVKSWVNPRTKISPKAMTGEGLYKRLISMSVKYDFDIQFCNKNQTGAKIIELLGG